LQPVDLPEETAMCPIVPVATLALGPTSFENLGLAAVALLYALTAAHRALHRKASPPLHGRFDLSC
jgi:phosphoribosylcarboxyaminoimidazole (NCAIR) mutase